MTKIHPQHGIGTLVNHVAEGDNPLQAHVTPIYQTSTFGFKDVASGAAIVSREQHGYYYTRCNNPNHEQLAAKIAYLEGLDVLRAQPNRPPQEIVEGTVFGSGMGAITTAILARAGSGGTIIAQEALYSGTFHLLSAIAPRYGIQVVFLKDASPQGWEAAFRAHPQASLAYAESPVNPTMAMVDLAAVAEIAHRYAAWLYVDNTFATPYCQRPLSLGADLVLHSTTKYLSGHGLVIGGALVSAQVDFMRQTLYPHQITLGASAGPFDAWLANIGLKTFELRMQRHCENAARAAAYLQNHPAVSRVHYPGLPDHPQHELASRQMLNFGAMLSFELKGGYAAGAALMERVRLCSLAVSLGNTDTLIQHPASMTHGNMPPEARLQMGISDGLVRFSVGIENIEDILADLEQALG